MILIADSGSTKTDWCVAGPAGAVPEFTTQGFNPVHQSEEEMDAIVQEVTPLSVAGRPIAECIEQIFFYGAGCLPEPSLRVKAVLQRAFPQARTVEVESDMLGAARALCGRQPGIVCILGTGSNSCYYNGQQIENNVPPLGYILGDEGSGAALGKRLAGDCLKQLLPEELCRAFLDRFRLTPAELIERVYRLPLANRFLAELSRFLYEHRSDEHIHRLLTECFSDFFRRNVMHYPPCDLFFTGSVAYYYAEELKETAARFGFAVAAIRKRPMEGLVAYHTNP